MNKKFVYQVGNNKKRKCKIHWSLKLCVIYEMLNVGSSTYIDRPTVNTTTQIICNSQHINEANITTKCTIKHDKFWQLLFFTASTMFKSLLANTMCVEF